VVPTYLKDVASNTKSLQAFVDSHCGLRHWTLTVACECLLKQNNSKMSRDSDAQADNTINKRAGAVVAYAYFNVLRLICCKLSRHGNKA
jgi:hypothetical protein